MTMKKRIHVDVGDTRGRIHARHMGVCTDAEISDRIVRTVSEALVSVDADSVASFEYSQNSARLELRITLLVAEARGL
jgi:hypothetical protein